MKQDLRVEYTQHVLRSHKGQFVAMSYEKFCQTVAKILNL